LRGEFRASAPEIRAVDLTKDPIPGRADKEISPDIEIETTFDNWLRFFSCKRSAVEFLNQTKISRATQDDTLAFLSMFDHYAEG
jgi:hypothetical protein